MDNKKHTGIWILVFLVGLMLVGVAGMIIFRTMRAYEQSDEAYEEVSSRFVTEEAQITEWMPEEVSPEVPEGFTDTGIGEKKIRETGKSATAEVDLESLTGEYPDVVGWIRFENEEISYPVLYSGDNIKYLRHTYDGTYASAGSIFVEATSTPDFEDPHTIVYGHNMRNLSMFGRLKYYRTDSEYYEDHQYFDIYTKEHVYRYRIFAFEEVSVWDGFHTVTGREPDGFDQLLSRLIGGSYRSTGVQVDENDHVVTLATCTQSDESRMLVCGVRVGVKDR